LNNLKLLEEYIIENNKKPSKIDKNKDIKVLGSWLSTQQKNYKNNENIMKNKNNGLLLLINIKNIFYK